VAAFLTLEDAVPDHLAWVFPGQGSQAIGMGREVYDAFHSARRVFDEADEILGFSLSAICFEGPEEKLRDTVNAQPAIVTASLACLKAALESGPESLGHPAYVAGHSLGEYSALIAAGALDFRDGLLLVRERGRLMQVAGQRNPGAMAAVLGLDESDLEEVCRETGAEICNVNGGGQIVIGGTRDAVARAMDLATARGAMKCLPLNVGGAFHSSLMQPAAEGMRSAITGVSFSDPLVPLISNVTGEAIVSGTQLQDELVQQVVRPVQWQRSVEYMVNQGVQSFVEIGPGKVLSGLIKRIAGKVQLRSISDAKSAEGR
jgi:[acyl-carrier-protein] S-malonyltransferase